MKHLKSVVLVIFALMASVSSAQASVRFGLNGGLNYWLSEPAGTDGEMGYVLGGNVQVGFVGFSYQGFVEYAKTKFSVGSADSIDVTNLIKFDLGPLYLGAGPQVQFVTGDGSSTNWNLAIAAGVDLSSSLFVDLRATTDFDDLFGSILTSLQLGYRL